MEAKSLKMKSGFSMPVLGIGTWRMTGRECVDALRTALRLGYRHIDTAELYGNEREIGQVIRGFDRSELFITTKVWKTNMARDKVISACKGSLDRLGTDYVDLYLIHWPNHRVPISETMSAMQELVESGMARSIGISNFDVGETKQAMEAGKVPVCVNQVEMHPHSHQSQVLGYCKEKRIVVTAYCPVERGGVMSDQALIEIGHEYGKTPAQVSLRWLVQQGVAVIPKSTNEEHLRENMDIFSWKLKERDMRKIDAIDEVKLQVNPALTAVPPFVARLWNRLR